MLVNADFSFTYVAAQAIAVNAGQLVRIIIETNFNCGMCQHKHDQNSSLHVCQELFEPFPPIVAGLTDVNNSIFFGANMAHPRTLFF